MSRSLFHFARRLRPGRPERRRPTLLVLVAVFLAVAGPAMPPARAQAAETARESQLRALSRVEEGGRGFTADDLSQAISNGDTVRVEAFLEAGWGPDRPLRLSGTRPLEQAIGSRQPAVVRLLLAQGAAVNAPNPAGDTPLMVCARLGSVEVARALLEAGAEVDRVNRQGRTAVHAAVPNSDGAAVLRLLLDRGADGGRPDADGTTPLMEAAQWGRLPALQALLAHAGPDGLARRDRWRQTALKRSLSNVAAQTPVARLLLAAGADPVAGGGGKTDLEWAWEMGSPASPDLEQAALQRFRPETGGLLGPAILHDRMEFAAALLATGESTARLTPAERLFLAAATGDTAALQAARAGQNLLSVEGFRGERLLERAARRGRPEVVRLLLDDWLRRFAGGTNPPRRWSCPALLAAAEGGDPRVVGMLLAAGADPNIRNFQGYRPLHLAARQGRLEAARLLLAGGAEADAPNNGQETALVLAARAGDARLVRALLAAGAKADGPPHSDATPLLAAVEAGRVEAARALVRAGANPYLAHGQGGQTAALAAALRGDPRLLAAVAPACRRRMLETALAENRRRYQDDILHPLRRALYQAIEEGQAERVRALIRVGAGPALGQDGFTRLPPDPAAPAVIRCLVRAGARLNARNGQGETALMVAAARGGPEAAAALLEAGARTDDENPAGFDALDLAAAGGNEPAVKALLQAGARPDGPGRLPSLYAACQTGQWSIARRLLARGARPDGRPRGGGPTPLMLAARRAPEELVRALLDAGADPALAWEGRTAQDLAARAGRPDIVRFLYRARYAHRPRLAPRQRPASGAGWEEWVENPYGNPDEFDPGIPAGDGSASLRPGFSPDRYLADAVCAGDGPALEEAVAAGYLSRLGPLAEGLLFEAVRSRQTALLPVILDAQDEARRHLADLAAQADGEGTPPFQSLLDNYAANALAAAIARDDAEAVRRLLDAGASANARLPVGLTPLQLAADRNPETVRLLLAHGASPDRCTEPVPWQRRWDFDRLFQDEDPAPGPGNVGQPLPSEIPAGLTPLFLALQRGQAEAAALLARAGRPERPREELSRPDPATGLPLLHEAAGRGDWPRLRILLAAGAEAGLADGEGRSALQLAASAGRLGAVRVLLAAGADPGRRDRSGRNAWHEAARGERVEIIRALSEGGRNRPPAGPAPLVTAFLLGLNPRYRPYERQLWTVVSLLDAGADVDEPDEGGRAALAWACARGWPETAALLLDRGAEVNRQDRDGRTPLQLALVDDQGRPVYGVSRELVRLLLDHGADVHRRDRSGKSPLDWAMEQKDPELIDLLQGRKTPGLRPLSPAAPSFHTR